MTTSWTKCECPFRARFAWPYVPSSWVKFQTMILLSLKAQGRCVKTVPLPYLGNPYTVHHCLDLIANTQYSRLSGSHRDADKTVSELGSNGVAMEVTQPECPSKVPLNDKLSAMLAASTPNKWYFDPRSPLSTEKGRRLARNCTDRKLNFLKHSIPGIGLEFCACDTQTTAAAQTAICSVQIKCLSLRQRQVIAASVF